MRGAFLFFALCATGCKDEEPPPGCFDLHGCVDGGADGDADSDADSDSDGDGDGDECADRDGDEHLPVGCEGGDDCLEGDPEAHPGATEVCNGVDDDCNGQVDEGLLQQGADVTIPGSALFTHKLAMAVRGDTLGFLTFEGGEEDFDHSLWFVELDASGQPAGTPVLVSDTPHFDDATTLSVAATEDGWAVTWAEVGDRDPTNSMNGSLAVARIVGGAVESVEADPELGVYTPAIASGTTTVAVAYLKNTDEPASFVVLAQDDLSEVAAGPLFTAGTYTEAERPAIAWATDHYIAALGADARIVVATIDEAGDLEVTGYADQPEARKPVLAWEDFGGALVYADLLSTQAWFRPIDRDGFIGDSEVTLGPGKLARLAALPGSFALLRLSAGDPASQSGAMLFSVLDLAGGVSNEMNPDDAASSAARDVAVVPVNGGWAVAWVTSNDWVAHFDRVVCPE